jgi:hypothetical protein
VEVDAGPVIHRVDVLVDAHAVATAEHGDLTHLSLCRVLTDLVNREAEDGSGHLLVARHAVLPSQPRDHPSLNR